MRFIGNIHSDHTDNGSDDGFDDDTDSEFDDDSDDDDIFQTFESVSPT